MRLELWYPAKPWFVTQAWGIYNPAYLQFGFDHHNGIDFLVGNDGLLHCPVQNFRIIDSGFGKDMGYYVRGVTDDVYDFPDGKKAKVYMVFMHGKEQPVIVNNTVIQTGDTLMIADNTGFSTGPHTHWYCARVDPMTLIDLDTNKEADFSFDQFPYLNRYYAVDSDKVLTILRTMIDALAKFISGFKIG